MRRAPFLALLLTACAGLAETTIYAGPVTPLAGTCDPPAQGELTLRAGGVVFTANSGTLVLHGKRSGNTLSATLVLPGPDKKPFNLVFTGELNANAVSGSYVTPRCRYHVALRQTAG